MGHGKRVDRSNSEMSVQFKNVVFGHGQCVYVHVYWFPTACSDRFQQEGKREIERKRNRERESLLPLIQSTLRWPQGLNYISPGHVADL